MKKIKAFLIAHWKPIALFLAGIAAALLVPYMLKKYEFDDISAAKKKLLETMPEREEKATKEYKQALDAAFKAQQKARADDIAKMFKERFGG